MGNWVSLEVKDVSYADLFDLTAHVIDGEGFAVCEEDRHNGTIGTKWNYEKITTQGRLPIRRRLETSIDPEGEGGFTVKIRIDQEANWKGYRLNELEQSNSWDEHGWDVDTAVLILKKIEIQVKDAGLSKEFEERHKKAEERKSAVPDVLR